MSLFMDRALARRVERCEGAINASFVETHARVAPDFGARWIEVAGAYAMYDGPESPMTQTFGLGVFDAVSAEDLSRIEAFYFERGSSVHHELSPLAGVALVATLVQRGYQPIEQSTVLVQALADVTAPAVASRARIAAPDEIEAWVACSIAGWAAESGMAAQMEPIARLAFMNPAMTSFCVERDGALIATGSLGAHEGVALLAGASTEPAHRGAGAQAALLAARLEVARARGCDLALMCTEPGSTSQRNAERNGFRVAYTRTKWRLDARRA